MIVRWGKWLPLMYVLSLIFIPDWIGLLWLLWCACVGGRSSFAYHFFFNVSRSGWREVVQLVHTPCLTVKPLPTGLWCPGSVLISVVDLIMLTIGFLNCSFLPSTSLPSGHLSSIRYGVWENEVSVVPLLFMDWFTFLSLLSSSLPNCRDIFESSQICPIVTVLFSFPPYTVFSLPAQKPMCIWIFYFLQTGKQDLKPKSQL